MIVATMTFLGFVFYLAVACKYDARSNSIQVKKTGKRDKYLGPFAPSCRSHLFIS